MKDKEDRGQVSVVMKQKKARNVLLICHCCRWVEADMLHNVSQVRIPYMLLDDKLRELPSKTVIAPARHVSASSPDAYTKNFAHADGRRDVSASFISRNPRCTSSCWH